MGFDIKSQFPFLIQFVILMLYLLMFFIASSYQCEIYLRVDGLMDNTDLFVMACRFFHASSACIYPEFKQLETTNVSLKESDAWPAEVLPRN